MSACSTCIKPGDRNRGAKYVPKSNHAQPGCKSCKEPQCDCKCDKGYREDNSYVDDCDDFSKLCADKEPNCEVVIEVRPRSRADNDKRDGHSTTCGGKCGGSTKSGCNSCQLPQCACECDNGYYEDKSYVDDCDDFSDLCADKEPNCLVDDSDSESNGSASSSSEHLPCKSDCYPPTPSASNWECASVSSIVNPPALPVGPIPAATVNTTPLLDAVRATSVPAASAVPATSTTSAASATSSTASAKSKVKPAVFTLFIGPKKNHSLRKYIDGEECIMVENTNKGTALSGPQLKLIKGTTVTFIFKQEGDAHKFILTSKPGAGPKSEPIRGFTPMASGTYTLEVTDKTPRQMYYGTTDLECMGGLCLVEDLKE